MSRLLFLASVLVAVQAANLVVIGDSWGTYGRNAFRNMVAKRGVNLTIENVAISGTTAQDWVNNHMQRLINAVSPADVKAVWLVVGGNDAQFFLPTCTRGRPECIAELEARLVPAWNTLVTAIVRNAGNRSADVVGFGYDIMSMSRDAGLACAGLPLAIFPSCYGNNECFNSEFTKIQGWMQAISPQHPQLTVLNLLGALQQAGGYNVTLGRPDLTRYSPASLYGDCIHPNDRGFEVLFDHMWDMFFSRYA